MTAPDDKSVKRYTFILPGTAVVFMGGAAPVVATVTKVMFEGQSEIPSYEVAWFNQGQRYAQWVQALEIKPADENAPGRLGFRPRGD
jgi:hypothetical protein